jgi:hypothetical protein
VLCANAALEIAEVKVANAIATVVPMSEERTGLLRGKLSEFARV